MKNNRRTKKNQILHEFKTPLVNVPRGKIDRKLAVEN